MSADPQSLLDAYADALAGFQEVAAGLKDVDWSRPTDCPGWTVREQVAHVLAVEQQLSGHPLPPRLASYPAYVRSPVGEHMESGIAALADLTPAELVARLGPAIEEHLAQLRALDLDPGTTVLGILGTEVPLTRFLPIRVLDVWTHEQDVRRATGLPARLTGPGPEVSFATIVSMLPHVVSQLAAPAGTVVAVVGDGDIPVAATVRMTDDGPATTEGGVAAGATVTVRMSTEMLGRLAGGRIDPAAAAVEVEGDRALGRRLLAELNIAP
jgi:uncharacterized protein (TIGR03083 family)